MVSRGAKVTIKLLSIACVFILLMTSFQVMTSNVSAADAEEDYSLIEDAQTHDARRLTISNEGAADPSAVVINGTLHLAWSNIVTNGEQLFYKSSIDNGTTFSSDRQISPTFYSISNVTINAFEDNVAICFEARKGVEGVQSVYLLYSSDSGNSWSQTYGISEGYSPTVGINEDGVFVGMTRPSEGKEYFVIVRFSISSNQLVNGTSIFALETGDGFGCMLIGDDSIDYAVYCRYPSDAVVYGSITVDGATLIAPSLIIGLNTGSVTDLSIAENAGTRMVVWSWNDDGASFIACSSFLSAPEPFGYCFLNRSSYAVGEVTIAPHIGNFFVAWESIQGEMSSISYADVLLNGTLGSDVRRLSTEGVVSIAPSAFADTNEVVSCVWVEGHRQTTELFYFKDITYDLPDIYQLKRWLNEQDDLTFTGGAEVKKLLSSEIDEIIKHVTEAREDRAIVEIDTMLSELDDLIAWRIPYDQTTSERTVEKVDHALKALKKNVDPNGSLSSSSSGLMLLEGGITISGPSSSVTADTATITWTTSISGTSVVQYGLTTSYGHTVTGSNGTSHSVTLTDLTPDTYYHYRVTSVSLTDSNDTVTSSDRTFRTERFEFDPLSNPIRITKTVHNATLTWDTTGTATSVVEYGLTTSYGSTATGANGTSHTVSLTGLSANTRYYYRVTSRLVSSPLMAITSADYFTTNSFTITSKQASPGVYTAVITWTTPEPATSVVQYGTTTSYGSTATGANGTSHSVTIFGLSASTTYHYKVSSSSFFNPPDTATSTDGTFATVAPMTISNINVNSITGTSAVITWTTSRVSTSVVEYGTTTSYGYTATGANGTSHSVTLTGLPTGSTIHYRVKSVWPADPSDVAISSDRNFQTPSIEIDGNHVDFESETCDSIVVTWSTNFAGTTVVDYVYSGSGQPPCGSVRGTVTGANGTEHSIILTGLAPGAQYRINVTSTSLTNPSDVARRNSMSFSTLQFTITGNVDEAPSSYSAVITWTTTGEATTVIEYGLTTSYGNTVIGANGTWHSVQLSSLTSGTRYYYRVHSDYLPNTAVTWTRADWFYTSSFSVNGLTVTYVDFTSAVITWTTSSSGTSVIQYGLTTAYGTNVTGASGTSHSVTITGLTPMATYHFRAKSVSSIDSSDVAYSTDRTLVANAISNVQVTSITSTSVIVTWTTSISCTTIVNYGSTASYGTTLTGTSGTTHSVSLTGLASATTYHFQVRSASVSIPSQVGWSSDSTFATLGIAIADVLSRSITTTTAEVVWNTSCSGTSVVEYGTTISYGSTASGVSGTAHLVSLTNLPSGTIIHYRVKSISTTNANDICYSTDRTMTTQSISATNVVVGSINTNSAVVTWTTSCSGTSVVDYGLTTSYGSTATGSSGTSHSVTLSNLNPNTTYHFRVKSVSSTNANDICYGTDTVFTTLRQNDAGQGVDAGSTTATALQIVSGPFSGDLHNTLDTVDHYKFYVFAGQSISIVLKVPAGFNYDLALLNPSGTTVASSSNGVGAGESLTFVATSTGYWFIKANWISGSGQGLYRCWLNITGGQDILDLNVELSTDMTVTSNLPGLSLVSGSGWGSVVNSMREGPANASFTLNLYGDSYQSYTGYLITVRYLASSDVAVQVLNNGVWIDIATMPGKSANWSYSFVLKPEYQYDALPNDLGKNVQIRFSHALLISTDTLSAVAYSYTTELGSPVVYHNPGISLSSGWILDGAIANGTSGAELMVSVAMTNVCYDLEFRYSDAADGMDVQIYTATGFQSIGTLHRWGTSAAVYLNRLNYYDADATAIGMNLRLKIVGAIHNLSAVTMTPSVAYTNVGSIGDEVYGGQGTNFFGASIYDNGKWAARGIVDGRTVRNVTSTGAYFLLNAPTSGQSYRIDIGYKTSTAGVVKQWDGTIYHDLGALQADGAWHCTSYWTLPGDFADYKVGSFINAIFYISAVGASVDYIYVYLDSDADTWVDSYEIAQGTSPWMADTDSDGLNDNIESSYGTSPTDPDHDDDGLLDGSEQWSQSWSTENFVKINGSGEGGYTSNHIYLSLPAIDDVTSQALTAAWIHIGLMHAQTNQVRVVIWKNGDSSGSTLVNCNVSGSSLFMSRNLFSCGYDASDFRTASTWTLFIDDYSSCGGQLQYFRIQVDGKTNPTVPDSDDDDILDGEEVNMGGDGWVTNPVLTDTDSDGLDDRLEIMGTIPNGPSTPCGQMLDPTCVDTDDDGFLDNEDRALGEMLVKVSITQFKLVDTLINYLLGIPIGTNSNPMIFYTISANGYFYSTERTQHQAGTSYSVADRTFYFDVYDCNSTITFTINAWADDPFYSNDDRVLDIGPPSTYSFVYTFDPGSEFVSQSSSGAIDGGEDDAEITVSFEKAIQPRTHTIFVNGVNEDGEEYGLDLVGDQYRYSCDEQVFILYLDCISGYGQFFPGMNTVVLPRCIGLSSQLSDILSGNAPLSGTALDGATIYTDDPAKSTSSGHVVAMISKAGITGQHANDILMMAVHNSSNDVVGEHRVISSDGLYLMHLPRDVLYSIPLVDIGNSGTGGAPHTWAMTFYNTVVTVGEFFMHSLVDRGFSSALGDTVVLIGLMFFNTLQSTVSTALQTLWNGATAAFNAFVNSLIDFVTSTIDAAFNMIKQAVSDCLNGYLMNLRAASNRVLDEQQNGSVSGEAIGQLASAITGPLFDIVSGIAIALSIIDLLLTPLKITFGFIIMVAVGLILTLVVQTIFKAALCEGVSQVCEWSWDAITSLAKSMGAGPQNSEQENSTEGQKWATALSAASVVPSCLAMICGAVSVDDYNTKLSKGLVQQSSWVKGMANMGLVFSALAIAISVAALPADTQTSIFMGLVALGLSGIGMIMSAASSALITDVEGVRVGLSIVDIIGLLIGGISIILSVESLVLLQNRNPTGG